MQIAGVRPFHFAWRVFCSYLGASLVCACPAQALAQAGKPADPKEITLECKDGLQMKCMWYPGNKEKETVPVVLLHSYKGSGDDFKSLATYLQATHGHAVLVPDLRGHGKSTKIKHPNEKSGEVDAAKFKQGDFLQLVGDLEKLKQFLVEKNNEKEVNIEKLTLVGSEMGATLAAKFALLDWAWPTLATGKQGQDVRALVLISPERNWKGLQLVKDVEDANVMRLSYMILAGRGSKLHKDEAEGIYGKLKLSHPDPAKDDEKEKKDLFLFLFETALQDKKLLGLTPLYMDKAAQEKNQPTDINALIAGFIQLRLVNKDYDWAIRKNALQ